MPMFPYTMRAFLGFNYSAAGSLITPPGGELLRHTFNQICTVPLVPRRFLQLQVVVIGGLRSKRSKRSNAAWVFSLHHIVFE